jgi:uncharacterized protein (DUF2141 family)
MKPVLIFLFIIYACAEANSYGQSSAGPVKPGILLTVSNIRNTKGCIRIGLFSDETGYPDKPASGYTVAKDTVKSGNLRIAIPLEKAGPYAVTLLDDENGNGKMDYVFGIMPREGFGFSNNPRIALRKAPPLKETTFIFKGGTEELHIKMVYIY